MNFEIGIKIYSQSKANSQASMKSQLSTVLYTHTGYNRWYDKNGYPISNPPWDTFTAVDMNSGKRQWQIPLGE